MAKDQYKSFAGYTLPVVLLGWFFWQLYTNGQHVEEARLAARNYATLREKYREYVNKAGRKEVMANQLILDQKAAIAAGLQEVNRLKSVDHQIQAQTKTHYSKILVPFKHPEIVKSFDTLTSQQGRRAITVPAPFHYSSEWLKMAGLVDTSGVQMDSIVSISQPTITLGMEKLGIKGLWKKPNPVATYSDANPYVRVTNLNILTIKEKQPFYSKPWFLLASGLAVGTIGCIVIH